MRDGSTIKIKETYRRWAERSRSGRYFPQRFITRFNEGVEARKKIKRVSKALCVLGMRKLSEAPPTMGGACVKVKATFQK